MPGCVGKGAGAACNAALLGRPPGALNTGAVAGVDAGAKAARLGLLCAEEAFCRAMLASLSRMMFGTAWFADGAAATLLPEPSEAKRLGGGLPGGVVDASVDRGMVRANCMSRRRAPKQSGEDNVGGEPTRGSRRIQPLLERVDHRSRERLALLPDIN